MQRRQFLAGVGAVLTAGAVVNRALALTEERPMATPDRIGVASDQAAVLFSWLGEEGIRSVIVRVSQWDDPAAAMAFHDLVLRSGGSNLPLGEFYQSDVTPYMLNEVPEGVVAGMVGWTTTVGVAAYHTGFALLSVLKGSLVWDVVVRASGEPEAVALAGDLLFALAERVPPPCSSLSAYLPDVEDMPPGATMGDYEDPVATPEFGDMDALLLPPVPLPEPADGGCGAPS